MKKACLYTFGCKVNQYETQLFREHFIRNGYEIGSSMEEADLVLVNSCTVTAEADRQCRQLVRKIVKRNPGAQVIVTGCYAVRSGNELTLLGKRVEVVTDKERFLKGSNAITEFSGHARAFVKIQDGCDAVCSYCIVPKVRSKLWSRPRQEVLGEIQRLLEKGYGEIVLSGVRLGKYEGGLAGLLKEITALPGTYRIRLSSLEIWEVGQDLVELMASEKGKICAHLHLPLQSGSDTILQRMRRPYSVKDFSSRLALIHRALPDAGISTDVIVGFPGESDQEFDETYRFIEKNAFSRLHVFPFSPRSGTVAATMNAVVQKETVRARSLRLRELDAKLQDAFWHRFLGMSRPAVREGGNATYITDNYIRLIVGQDMQSTSVKIPSLKIMEKNGQAWGVPVS